MNILVTATKPQLKVVFDLVGTPTYALDLAKAITAIIDDYKREVSSQLAAQGSPLTANSQQPTDDAARAEISLLNLCRARRRKSLRSRVNSQQPTANSQ